MPNSALLEIASLRIAGIHAIVSDVALRLNYGESVAILGPSGAGKSSLALAVLGLLAPNLSVEGSVRFAGIELLGLSRDQIRRATGGKVGVVFEDRKSVV